jgi:hypothetical protein
MPNNLEFVLKLYEVSGKNIVRTYIDDISKRLDLLAIKYEFRVINEDDSHYLNRNMFGGSDSTQPYNFLESFFDKLSNRFSGIIPENTKIKDSNKKSVFDRLFSSFSDNPETVVHSDNITHNVTETPVENEYDTKISGETMVIPSNYTGVLVIHLTIFSTDFENYEKVCGLKQLENWLNIREGVWGLGKKGLIN